MGATIDLRTEGAPASPLLLWTGILTGPIAWSLDLGASYALVHWSCWQQRTDVLHLISVVSFATAVASGLLAWSLVRAIARHESDRAGGSANRARFMARLGVASSALFALAIVAFAIPRWMLDACQ